MLNPIEKIVLIVLIAASLTFTWRGFRRVLAILSGGQGRPNWNLVRKRALSVFGRVTFLLPVFRLRPFPSIFHGLIAWGFFFYLLVFLSDLLQALIPNFRFLENAGEWGTDFRLLSDAFTVAILAGVLAMAVRRFVIRPKNLTTRPATLLIKNARSGIKRDSAIVLVVIFIHVGSRFVSESFYLAASGLPDRWQPFATQFARLWSGLDQAQLMQGWHVAFWVWLCAILLFLPYFPRSKHMHLIMAPINFLLKPERNSMGEQNHVTLNDPENEQVGAATLEHLDWEQLMDAYACIQCFRCQDVCPPYAVGASLSPAALEINKRYNFNNGGGLTTPLTDLITPEAAWACTTCGACVDICPVGAEPMRDILAVRRNLAMMEKTYPNPLDSVFEGMQQNASPWNLPPSKRLEWAQGLVVPTIEENPAPEILWWVGCAPASDPRAQGAARAFAQILIIAGVNFAVLGNREACTGDSARRAGREDIFQKLAVQNIHTLNEVNPRRIVTTCPHCLHTLKNEYPAFGGNYQVIHHTQLINELVGAGKLQISVNDPMPNIEKDPPTYKRWYSSKKPPLRPFAAYHDPCYLGRYNGQYGQPRKALRLAKVVLLEMPRNAETSFCCGAGGGLAWDQQDDNRLKMSQMRYAEAKQIGLSTLAVACPFCQSSLGEASRADGFQVQVRDVAEIVLERIKR